MFSHVKNNILCVIYVYISRIIYYYHIYSKVNQRNSSKNKSRLVLSYTRNIREHRWNSGRMHICIYTYIWCITNYTRIKIRNGLLLYYCYYHFTIWYNNTLSVAPPRPPRLPQDVGYCQTHLGKYIYIYVVAVCPMPKD